MAGDNTVVYGIHAVESVIRFRAKQIQQLFLLRARNDKRLTALRQLAVDASINILEVDKRELERLCGSAKHQGAVAKINQNHQLTENDFYQAIEQSDKPAFILVLDGVEDPHNLGACLRVADAAGVDAVLVPKSRGCKITAAVRKVSAGAADAMPFVEVSNLARALKELKTLGVWVVGTAGETEQTLYQTNLKGSLAIVMGNEGEGMRRLTKEHCDILLKIPMQGYVSSLNVSVATGIVLFEARRQNQE